MHAHRIYERKSLEQELGSYQSNYATHYNTWELLQANFDNFQ